MAIQISQFRRPGIYIQEIDQSLQITPVQETLINLVAGFSKRGPVNRPVLVNSPAEFNSVFGDIDRALEKKGSYFHRTVQNIINQSPVWALNLLHTDDELDLLEWQSISLAANITNSSLYDDPYSNFFNRNEFWVRDTEAFLDVAHKRQPTRIDQILNITNMSDARITVFINKSDISGFDIKAEDWYEGRENVPSWMYYDDYMSDYMVTVTAVAGDWSDYQQLAVDSRWGQYFNTHGLIKDQLLNFISDTSVTLLNKYDVSLIPFFRDQNGTDFYIETVINRDTDTTGLFVAYDVDALETDYPNGIVDLIGHTLIGEDVNMIDFISYKEVITETVSFTQQPLVSAGNTFIEPSKQVDLDGELVSGLYETKWISSPNFLVIPSDPSDPSTSSVSRITLEFTARLILNGTDLYIPAAQEVVVNDVTPGRIRKDTLYIDSLGQMGVATGIEVNEFTDWDVVPTVAIADVLYAIGIVQVGTHNDGTGTGDPFLGVADESNITVLAEGISGNDYDFIWKTLTSGTDGTEDADIVLEISAFELTVTFNRTKAADENIDYKKTRLLKIFDDLRENVLIGDSVITTTTVGRLELIDVSYLTDPNFNRQAKFTIPNTYVIASPVELYYADNALTFGEIGMRAVEDLPDYGVASSASDFYGQFYDGIIKSGDYFYQNIVKNGDGVNAIEFTKDSLGQSIITMYTRDGAPEGEVDGPLSGNIEIDGAGGDMVFIKGTEYNSNIYTLLSASPSAESNTKGGVDYDYKLELIVNESVIDENHYNSLVTLHDGNEDKIVYLRMYTIQNELYTDFVNSPQLEVAGEQVIVPANNPTISVFSDRSNFSQTLEIESVLEQNQFLIDANRYGEVTIGQFIEAAIPADLPIGYVPKKLTRIVKRQIWEADPSLALIATDAAVAFFDADPSNNADIQAVRHTSIEKYVNTLQAHVLTGFTIRTDSMPDGTEERQNDILNIMAPGTPIFKGLTNRNQLSWRYFVDCWGLGLTSNSKQQMVDLCGARLNALGLLNMPSAKSFKNSTNPSFTDDDGTINYEFVRLGGDPESNPAFTYTFGQGQGQTNVAYFYPYTSINDNGRPVNVPPSMFVTNTFMNKHNSRRSDMYPWTIAAGVTNGLVVGFGATEVDLIGEDIEELNQMGANPVVFKLNRGYNIETNNTAQAVPKTALSNIHVREVLIELENEMYNMLLTYQWRFNTTEVRAEIKQRADAICARFVSQNGLYDYFNVMDETNNTSDIIDAGIGVIDTYVEPIKGMGIIVNNITILSTGTIQSGGFISNT